MVEVLIEEMVGSKPWSSMQLVKGSRTRPLAGVNGEVCIEKRKKLWKERKKDLTRASIVRDGWEFPRVV